MTDKSNGYESVAIAFIERRGGHASGIGTTAIRQWTQTLPPRATVLDLGCGTGLPVTHVLRGAGLSAYGVDASPTLVAAFRRNFPEVLVACEAVEESSFFHRQFDAVVACGLLFLLPLALQKLAIQRVALALHDGGRFLFTAPAIEAEWQDALTGRNSVSPGREIYQTWLATAGLSLLEEFEDEGQNHYFDTVKRG